MVVLDEKMGLQGALAAAAEGRIEEWVHEFLHTVGNNKALSEGLMLQKRYWVGPLRLCLDELVRCAGLGSDMEYQMEPVRYEQHITGMVESIKGGWEPPPLIATYQGESLSVRDGNHRYEALLRCGITDYWVIIWTDSPEQAKHTARTGHSTPGA